LFALTVIVYVPTSSPDGFDNPIFKPSLPYTVPVVVLVNASKASPYTLVLSSAVTVTAAFVTVRSALAVTVPL
jgi:hypothetical protein